MLSMFQSVSVGYFMFVNVNLLVCSFALNTKIHGVFDLNPYPTKGYPVYANNDQMQIISSPLKGVGMVTNKITNTNGLAFCGYQNILKWALQ